MSLPPPHVVAVEQGNFAAAITSNKGGAEVQADGIAVMVDGVEILDVEDVGDSLDVAAQRPADQRRGIEEAFALCRVNRIVDGVVADGRRNRAGDNAVQSAGAGDCAVLQLLE